MTAASPEASRQAVVEAALVLLERMGLSPADLHRVVSFISVVGCGTRPSSGIRQNRRQEIESLTSAHRLS